METQITVTQSCGRIENSQECEHKTIIYENSTQR